MLDNGPMHIVIPYAAPLGPQCQAALAQLQLPVLAALLELLQPTPTLGQRDLADPAGRTGAGQMHGLDRRRRVAALGRARR